MQNEKEKDKSIQHYASLGFAFICVVVGIPLWWKTTEVYRVSLPYSDISRLSDIKFRVSVDVDVLNTNSELQDADLTQLSKLLTAILSEQKSTTVIPRYRVTVKQASENQRQEILVFNKLTDLDSQFQGDEFSFNKYQMILLPPNNKVKLPQTTVGNNRATYITAQKTELKEAAERISSVLENVLIKEDVLSKSYKKSMGSRQLKQDKESMRSLRYHPGYDILFTLVNPQPDILNVDWDIKLAVDEYVEPLIKQLEGFINLDVKSQMIFFAGLGKRPTKATSTGEFHYKEKDLPHTINPLESKLGSHASNNPMLNFIVYVPSRDQHPLFILDRKGNKLKTNSFLSPRWGGIHIHNLAGPTENETLPVDRKVNMVTAMEIFMTQLRLLMDFKTEEDPNIDIRQVDNSIIRKWELDDWLRKRCFENIATSISTLQSLTSLLEGISNIVIQDDIGKQVQDAVDGIKEAQRYLNSGQIDKSFTQSRKAIIASEKAFFDPSLLELLYFPEDQKFAIYIPLFLPVSLPVFGSLYKAFQWIKQKRKQKLKQE